MKHPIDQAQRFFRLAEADTAAFHALKNHPNVTIVITCFHAQQAVEKFIKTILALHKIEVRKTHDLYELTSLLIDQNIDAPYTPEEYAALNPYAVVFRYDDIEIETLTITEAETMVNNTKLWAKKIIETII